jgi:tRNA-specific 2-thiouridylase/uncharacterized protein
VGADELDAALDPEFAKTARTYIAECGFEHVTLDLRGYQTGSVSPETTDEERTRTTDGVDGNVTDTDYPTSND